MSLIVDLCLIVDGNVMCKVNNLVENYYMYII